MPEIINSYEVGTVHGRGELARWIGLKVGSGARTTISISFWANEPSDLGYALPTGNYIHLNLRLRDFDDYYRILQTESPLNVHWTADSSRRIMSFQMTSSDEPLGEGPTDSSSS